jgi:hypothetical protein
MPPLSPALPAPRKLLLGPADVADDELAAFAAAGLGVRRATVLTSSATVFPYARPAITTAGRYLVTGTARTGTGEAVWISEEPSLTLSAPFSQVSAYETSRPLGADQGDLLRAEANDCPMSSCAAPAGSPCRTGQGGRPVPYRPVPARAPSGEGPQRPGPAAPQAGLGLDRTAPPSGGRLRVGGACADRIRPRLHRPPVARHPDRLAAHGACHEDLRREGLDPGSHPARARPSAWPGRSGRPGPRSR